MAYINRMPTGQPTTRITLEVCIASLTDAMRCLGRGVQRVELNAALELGGLTPSIGVTERVVDVLKPGGCRVVAMIRPRPGGFVYSDDERAVMRRDIDRLIEAGVDGLAFGVLLPDNTIDADACASLIEPIHAAGREAVFHRAFDLTPRPAESLDGLIDLGFTRVLTGGARPSAIEGADTIRALVERAAGRIEVLPGGGIRPSNVADLIRAAGCTQVHASLRSVIDQAGASSSSPIGFNSAPAPEPAYFGTDDSKLAAMIEALRD